MVAAPAVACFGTCHDAFSGDFRWQESLKRFEHIFDQSEGGRRGFLPGRGTPRIPTYTLPGNHDLGYEAMESANTKVLC